MDNLIKIINKLQETLPANLFNTKIKLPQLVVLGSQSSGKSSIIESIVGKDFLPRGTGIVTRRPLILQLKHIEKGVEWAEFSHLNNKKIEDFSTIVQEIEIETSRVAGYNKGISNDPIILKIFSQNVIDLTLVDLPGIVKVPMGDQPDDIESKVRDLLIEYISNPNALILAVTPANIDIANSDALKLAKEVDPKFQRTMGIITKLDLIDKGTSDSLVNILQNKAYWLRLGYIGVICRSQDDNNKKKSIQEAIYAEERYISNNEELSSVNDLLGNKILKATLSKVLKDHIKSSMPNIKELISSELTEKERELINLGSDPGFDKQEIVNSYILTLVSKFTHTYNEMIDGNFVRDCSKYYIGGARINFIFQEIFKKEITNIDPFNCLSDEDIRTAIKNSNGLKPSLFIPEAAFEVLIKQQIERFSSPALMCVRKVYEELKNIVNYIEISEISRYKKLENKIKSVMENVLDSCLEPTNQMIKNLIDIEKSYINTNHPDFMGSDQSVVNIFDEGNSNNIINQSSNDIRNNNNNNQISGFNNNNYSNGNNNYRNNYNNNEQMGGRNNYDNSKINSAYEDEGKKKYEKGNEEENDIKSLNKNNNQLRFQNKMRPGIPTNRDIMETMIIKNLISSYYHVVKKNINDLVPKTIMCFLVNQSKLMAEKEMVTQLYKSEELDTLLSEDPNIAKKRKNCKDNLLGLKKSLDILSEFNELNID